MLGLNLTLKIEVTYSSETSNDFQLTTRHEVSEDRAFDEDRCEDLKLYAFSTCFVVSISLFFCSSCQSWCNQDGFVHVLAHKETRTFQHLRAQLLYSTFYCVGRFIILTHDSVAENATR